MVTAPSYDTFYDSEGLADLLATWASERPDLLSVESIGRSWKGRDLWLATCTDTSTGSPADKPAIFVEGNIHAAELTSSTAALHLLHRLLVGVDEDERVRRALATRTFYVLPRVCPDGAEEVLLTGRYVRSSLRPHPDSDPEPGLHQGDVDGDGRSLFMRFSDPHGPWKLCPADPRLLVRREPDEDGGDYFRLLLEGDLSGYDGATVRAAAPREGLDLAANFHSDWPDLPGRPRDAGPFAGSEPEIQALLRAVTDRPNITSYLSLHTFGAVHLRPPVNGDDVLPANDLARYDEMGERATALTGYPVMAYDDLKHTPYRVRGGQLDWLYRERGVYAWVTELWNPLRAAGLPCPAPARWLVEHGVEDDLALLRWSDRALGHEGFVDWYPFDHPQLGKVEIGGWDLVHTWYNPPPRMREAEIAPHTEWAIFVALASPLLDLVTLESEQVSGDVHLIRAVVGNTGWLPTHVTEQARQRSQTPPVTARLVLPPGAHLVSGASTVGLGQLSGRSGARSSTTWWGHDPGTPDRAMVEWVVRSPAGADVQVTVSHPRAGAARREVTLGSPQHRPDQLERRQP